MIIRPDGSAELKARPFTERVDIGKAVYNGTNRLSVYLESSGRGSYSHLLFNTGNRWREGTQYIYGVSSRFNSEDHPSARLEVLVVAGDENFEDMKAVAFDIGTNEFYRQDEAADGILSYLRMNSLQTAVSRYQPNIAVAPIRKVDPANFYAACYVAAGAKTDEELIQSLRFLYLAYINGFGQNTAERELIKKEKERSLKTAPSFKMKAAPAHTDFQPMTFEALLNHMLNHYQSN